MFNDSRNHCKRVITEARSSYAEATRHSIAPQRIGSRDFWRICNSVLNRGKSTIPPLFNGPEVLTTSTDKANLFARNFSYNSTLDDSYQLLPDFPSRTEYRLTSRKITARMVSHAIYHLDTCKATGPDRIPSIVIKMCSPELSPVLAKLYNKCLAKSCVPSCWKSSEVVPAFKNDGDRSDPGKYRHISLLSIVSKIFESRIPSIVIKMCSPELSPVLAKLYNKCLAKSCVRSCWKSSEVVPAFKNDGDRSDPGKYRHISLLSIVSKIFESFINDSFIKHLDSTGLFSDLQYGFRTLRSTADILTVLSERIYNSMDAGGETRAIALDISKAFDKVWHAGLLHKLKSYGVVGPILGILESFMIERSLKVVLDGQSSPLFLHQCWSSSGISSGTNLIPGVYQRSS